MRYPSTRVGTPDAVGAQRHRSACDFPTPHTDFFTQYVRYPVPPAKASELVAFDGSTLIDRTTGELGARCDHEAYNTLTLNLAVEILEGKAHRR